MEIRYLENNEKNRIRELYDKVFNDTQDFVDYYFGKINENDILVVEDEGNIISMLQLVKKRVMCNGEEVSVHYIYGVATDEKYRGKGHMGMLMERALKDLEKLNEPFVYLTPANASIYTKFGFETVYDKQIYEIRNIEEKNRIFKPGDIDIHIMKTICDNILPIKYKVYIVHDEDYLKEIINQLVIDGGYLTYHKDKEEIIGYSIVGNNGEVWESVFDTKPVNLVHKRTLPWIMIKKFDEDVALGKVFINDET